MEIDFMILWKEKAKTNNDIFLRVENMLNTLYYNVSDYDITYIYSNNEIVLPYKLSKDNNKIVYLKVECRRSEAKAANILSSFKNTLCNGKHREDFSIICTLDEASLSYCCRLMKHFGIFERRLREIMYLSTVKAFGSQWVKETFTDELYNTIKEKTKGKNDEKITELALEYLDYNEIILYLFEKRELISREELLNYELSEERLTDLSRDEIILLIRKMRLECLWNKLFINNQNLQLTEYDLKKISQCRNDVMHHHTFDENQYKETYQMVKKFNNQLSYAIEKLEEKIYTQEEYGYVFANMGILVSKIVDFFGIVGKRLVNIVGSLNKLAENVTIVFPDSSKYLDVSVALGNILAPPYLSENKVIYDDSNDIVNLNIEKHTEEKLIIDPLFIKDKSTEQLKTNNINYDLSCSGKNTSDSVSGDQTTDYNDDNDILH